MRPEARMSTDQEFAAYDRGFSEGYEAGRLEGYDAGYTDAQKVGADD